MNELACVLECEGESLCGVLHRANTTTDVAVMIVVGGPQTKAGSHRQFVLLARAFAHAGFHTLRFDVRGMGDSTGEENSFEDLDADIGAATIWLKQQLPEVKKIVLWGLCDGASAAMMAPSAAAGLILVNPWVHQAHSHNQAIVQNYYRSQLLSATFWGRVLKGEVNLVRTGFEAMQRLVQLFLPPQQVSKNKENFVERMRLGWAQKKCHTLIFLSGRDLTADEFKLCAAQPLWQDLMKASMTTVVDLPEANHTFAKNLWRQQVINRSIEFLNHLKQKNG